MHQGAQHRNPKGHNSLQAVMNNSAPLPQRKDKLIESSAVQRVDLPDHTVEVCFADNMTVDHIDDF